MEKAVLLIVIFIVAVAVGSFYFFPEVDFVAIAESDPAVADFVEKNPNAETQSTVLSQAEAMLGIGELIKKCGPQIIPTDYYYVSFQQGGEYAEVWIYGRSLRVACVHRSDDQCVRDADCEDGDLCTKDVCSGIPKVCSSEAITVCRGGDGCCVAGCTFSEDFDCEADECSIDEDCNDNNSASEDFCEGIPRSCVHYTITECLNNDGFCPRGCNFSTDTDCQTGECQTDAECDDNDPGTWDSCSGSPSRCLHRQKTECIDGDNYCPDMCTYKTDSDCVAMAGDKQRLIVTCLEEETKIDKDLLIYANELKASFESVVSHPNNDALLFYEYKDYKYNGRQTGDLGAQTKYNTTIVERVKINARGIYDKEKKGSFLYFNRNGLEYEVELVSGIPAVESDFRTQNPFIAGNDDKIAIALFGTDSLVTMVNQNEGQQQVELLSDYTEIAVPAAGVPQNLEGNGGKTYSMRVARCDEDSAIFSLYIGDDLIESQTAATGDMLFEDKLAKATRLNFLRQDYATKRCNYRYAAGTHLEKIYHDKEFPLGSESGWKSYLEFDNDRLKKIIFRKAFDASDPPMVPGEEEKILPGNGTLAGSFCKMLFAGLAIN